VIEPEAESPPANRMGIALFALAGLLISAYLLLHRMGFIGTLACGESGGCETVQTSIYSVFLGVPVPAWGILGYALILAAAVVGLQERFISDRRVALAILALSVGAFAFSAYLSALEQWVIGAWCRWCIASAVVATLIFLFSLAEIPRVRRVTT
jgi:uncharacterized membrane protein